MILKAFLMPSTLVLTSMPTIFIVSTQLDLDKMDKKELKFTLETKKINQSLKLKTSKTIKAQIENSIKDFYVIYLEQQNLAQIENLEFKKLVQLLDYRLLNIFDSNFEFKIIKSEIFNSKNPRLKIKIKINNKKNQEDISYTQIILISYQERIRDQKELYHLIDQLAQLFRKHFFVKEIIELNPADLQKSRKANIDLFGKNGLFQKYEHLYLFSKLKKIIANPNFRIKFCPLSFKLENENPIWNSLFFYFQIESKVDLRISDNAANLAIVGIKKNTSQRYQDPFDLIKKIEKLNQSAFKLKPGFIEHLQKNNLKISFKIIKEFLSKQLLAILRQNQFEIVLGQYEINLYPSGHWKLITKIGFYSKSAPHQFWATKYLKFN